VESHPGPFSPAAVVDALETAAAPISVSLVENAAKATVTRNRAAGAVSKADSAFRTMYIMPVMFALAAISCVLMCCIAKYDTLALVVKDAPVSFKYQTAEALCMDTPQPPSPMHSDELIDLSAHICPTVIMPSSESRFAVPLQAINAVGVEGSIDIADGSGDPVFRAFVRKAKGGRKLWITMAIEGSTARASICSGAGSGATSRGEFEICGPGNSLYGKLQRQRNDRYSVMRAGRIVMIIDGDPKRRRPGLKVVSAEGQPLSFMSWAAKPELGGDHLEISVRPNVDSVLILVCVFAIFLLV